MPWFPCVVKSKKSRLPVRLRFAQSGFLSLAVLEKATEVCWTGTRRCVKNNGFSVGCKDFVQRGKAKKPHRLGWDEQIAVLPVALPERNHVKMS